MMKRLSHLTLAALGMLGSQAALAAPFCVTGQALPPQCIYYDAQQCDVAARQQNGACTTNAQALRLRPGNGHFCVVTSAQVSNCNYADRATCARDATTQHGICTDSPPSQAGVGVPDPYSPVNGR